MLFNLISLINIKTLFETCESIKVIEKAIKRCLQQAYYHTNYRTNKGKVNYFDHRVSMVVCQQEVIALSTSDLSDNLKKMIDLVVKSRF